MNNNEERKIKEQIDNEFKEVKEITLNKWLEEIKKINCYNFLDKKLPNESDKYELIISEDNIIEFEKIIDKYRNQTINTTEDELEEFRKKHNEYIKEITSENYNISDKLVGNIIEKIKKINNDLNNRNDMLKEMYDSEAVTLVINTNKDKIISITNSYVNNIFVKTFEQVYNNQLNNDNKKDNSDDPFSKNTHREKNINIFNLEQCLFIFGISNDELLKYIDNATNEHVYRCIASYLLISRLLKKDITNITYLSVLYPKESKKSEEDIIIDELFLDLSQKYKDKFDKTPIIPEPDGKIEECIKVIIKCLETGCDDYNKIIFPVINESSNNILY